MMVFTIKKLAYAATHIRLLLHIIRQNSNPPMRRHTDMLAIADEQQILSRLCGGKLDDALITSESTILSRLCGDTPPLKMWPCLFDILSRLCGGTL